MTIITKYSIIKQMMHEKLVDLMINKNFSRGSTTYSKSSLFFPKEIYKKIALFYSFVRIIDNLVDQSPVQEEAFYYFKEKFYNRRGSKQKQVPLIEKIQHLIAEHDISIEYFDAFWNAMEFDLQKTFVLHSLDECKQYMYGSAEIIGLIICSICKIDKAAYPYAALLGRSMQFANFIRDIQEDSLKGRQYIPLLHTRLRGLTKTDAYAQSTDFVNFIHSMIDIYFEWVKEAFKGFAYLPPYLQIPILTATQSYHFIMIQIYKDPFKIYTSKIRPSPFYVLFKGMQNMIRRDRCKFNLQQIGMQNEK